MKTDDGADEGRDADAADGIDRDGDLRPIETLVRGAALRTTRELDERVLAELAGASGERGGAAPSRWKLSIARIAAGILVVVALGGALVAAVALIRQRRAAPLDQESAPSAGRHEAAPAVDPPLPLSVKADRAVEPFAAADAPTEEANASEAGADEVIEEPEPTTIGMGIPSNVDARATVREAQIIARVRLDGSVKHVKGQTFDLPRGTIEAIYKGDPTLVGREVTIHPKRIEARVSFLCWRFEASSQIARGVGNFILPLEVTNVGIPESGAVHLRASLCELVQGTHVAPKLPVRPPTSIESEVVAMLRDDLAASLASPSRDVRISSITALRNWSGESFHHDVSELWRDEATAKALIAAGHDDDTTVRMTVAWMVTPAAGTAGRDLLEDLQFDRDAMVRQTAARKLADQGGSNFLDTIESVRDTKWDLAMSGPSPIAAKLTRNLSEALRNLKEHAQPEVRGEIAWALGSTGPSPEKSAALLAALDDSEFEVRRGAARSLGAVGGDGVADRLDGIADSEDARVRVMAAWSQVKLGDRRGYAHLSRLVANEDLRAAAQTCAVLGWIAKRDAVGLLLVAARDPRPAVRGAAVLALTERARKSDAPHRAEVEALLASAEKDGDAYVRAAARAALARRSASKAEPVSNDEQRLLGKIGYVDDSGDDDSDDE